MKEAPKSVGQSGSARFSFNRSGPGLQPGTIAQTSPQRTVKGSRPDLQHEMRPTVFGALRVFTSLPREFRGILPEGRRVEEDTSIRRRHLLTQITVWQFGMSRRRNHLRGSPPTSRAAATDSLLSESQLPSQGSEQGQFVCSPVVPALSPSGFDAEAQRLRQGKARPQVPRLFSPFDQGHPCIRCQ